MKKLIGLLVVFFIASLGQVFAEVKPCKVGGIGPSGGYVFFCDDLKNPKLTDVRFKNSCAGQCIGLEVAPDDQKGDYQWCHGNAVTIDDLDTKIGKGLDNTVKIVRAQGEGNYAALSCYERERGTNNKSYWFLPSEDELELIYTNIKTKHPKDFATDFYWSSSHPPLRRKVDFAIKYVTVRDFGTGELLVAPKASSNASTRCARAF